MGARSGAGRDRSASQACRGTALVCGWRWDPALVFLVARPCSRCLCGPRMAPAALSRGPRRACLPAPPRRCRPLLLVPRVRPPRAPFPCLGPSRPRLMWVSFPRPPSAGGVPEAGRRAGSLARVGDVGAAGARRESVLPGRLAALGCVSVAVGVSPGEGAGTPGGAQRDPPPTRRGEARAAVGNERHTAPPRGRRTRPPPPPEGRCGAGCSAHALLAAATAATAHSGGAAAGGSDTPRLPLGSLEKAFSPRARRPSPGSSLSFGPTEALHEPPVLSWGGRGLRYR